MVQILRKPQKSSLSPARWEFVDELWIHHEAAGRPKVELIVDGVRALNEVNETGGTVSTETIRRMLKGETVPVHWSRVRAALFVLCGMAGYDPQKPRENDFGDDYPSHEENLRRLWSQALDDPHRGKPVVAAPRNDGGWGGGYSDEPPF